MKRIGLLLAIIGIMLAMRASAQYLTSGYPMYSPYLGNYHYTNNYYTGTSFSPGYTNGNYVQLGFQTPYGGMGLSVGWQNTPSTTVASTPEVIWIDPPASGRQVTSTTAWQPVTTTTTTTTTTSGGVVMFNYAPAPRGGLAIDEYPQYKTLTIYPERCCKRKRCRSW